MTTEEPTLAETLAGVDGWLHMDEAEMLYDAVKTSTLSADQPMIVVEIGTLFGRSAIALALAVKERRAAGRVYAVDPHELGSEQVFRKNVHDRQLDEIIKPVLLRSDAARSIVDNDSVHVMFIDGGHDYHTVLRDLDDWLPALADGAVVALNDTHWPGVHRALRERMLGGAPYFNPRLVRSTLFFDVRRTATFTPADTAAKRRLVAILYTRLAAGRVRRVLPKPARQLGNKVTQRVLNR
jgi:predicted O-methyltransferase YrrM